MKVYMKNQFDAVKQVKIGFSWTMLFFGFFTPLVRGDWKWFLIALLLGIITLGLSNIVLAFIYNKLYIKDLIERGWMPADDNCKMAFRNSGIYFAGSPGKPVEYVEVSHLKDRE